jgi:hypothetical protein
MIIITDTQFIRTFKPEQSDSDEFFVQRNYGFEEDSERIDLAKRENRLWTALYDNGWQLRSGECWEGNVLYYVICDVPNPAGKKYMVRDEDEDEEIGR